MKGDQLKNIQKNSNNKDIALLAQEVGFLVEKFEDFKNQTAENFDEVKSNTSGNYGSLSTQVDHEKRITRLEKVLLGGLIFVFIAVATAVLGSVIAGGN